MLSAEHNDSQTEEINVIDESQAENERMSGKKIKLAAKKFLWSAILFVVLSGRTKHSLPAHSLSQLGE